jgi:large subunit ribosomal protein L17
MISSPRSSLGRKPAKRISMMRNLVTSLILYESIRTTRTRAKIIQPVLDRMITKAKTRPPHIAVRFLNRIVTDKNASRKVFEVLLDRYKGRTSGFARIAPLGRRKGDGAELVEISLIDAALPEKSPVPFASS